MKDLYEYLLCLEKEISKDGISSIELKKLKKLFFNLEETNEKIFSLHERLFLGMNLEQLMCFIVPVERVLKKKVTDTSILIEKEDRTHPLTSHKLIVVLDNMRSAFNVGAAMRSCEALGVKQLILTGYTPGVENLDVKKISMGAWKNLNVVKMRDVSEVQEYLKNIKYETVGVETVSSAETIFQLNLKEETALFFGNERFGLSESDLLTFDKLAKLPVFGKKNSLNINAALTTCGYEWVRQHL